MSKLTAERLHELLVYEPSTGVFTWRVFRGGTSGEGSIAGSTSNDGYRIIKIDLVCYKANRLAWLYMTGQWPDTNIDHRDNDRLNDIWENLREASVQQNAANRRRHSNNRSGFKGVYFRKDNGRWGAKICVRYQPFHLGLFDTAEEAHAAYVAAAEKHFGEFARAA